MQSKATTVAQYLAELPEDRRQTIETVRRVTAIGFVKTCEAALQKKKTGPDTNSAKKSGKGPKASQGAKSVAKSAARKKSAKKRS